MNKRRVLYLRHIVRKISYRGAGKALLTALIEMAKANKYEFIVADLLEQPVENKISKEFHMRFGFKKAGTFYDQNNHIWGVYQKSLQ